ncbi:MAG: hypothetical protein M3376_04880, partial [Actinomycetota bacterium]|nr:hypothetical protein [Actinomycetota bacterium]
RRSSVVACVVCCLGSAGSAPVVLGAAAGSAQSARCAPQAGALANVGNGFGRVWHRGRVLYACSIQSSGRPRTRRIGPWTPATKIAFDGQNLAWTVRMVVGGRLTDRVWASGLDNGARWLVAQKPNPAGPDRASRESLVLRIVGRGGAVGWVTANGALVAAVRNPGDAPIPIGTPAIAPALLQKHLIALGTYHGVSARSLANSLKIADVQSEGDDCGGIIANDITVRPGPSAEPVGAHVFQFYANLTGPCG